MNDFVFFLRKTIKTNVLSYKLKMDSILMRKRRIAIIGVRIKDFLCIYFVIHVKRLSFFISSILINKFNTYF